MTNSVKHIRLTPLGTFFFGGENTFGATENRNYFVKSNLMPQQTSLLGLLRLELLRSSPSIFDLKTDTIIDKNAAIALIGGESFDGVLTDFGAIRGLSPVFLAQKGVPFFFRGKEYFENGQVILEENNAAHFENLMDANATTTKRGLLKINATTAYDGKTDFDAQLVNAKNETNDVFFDKKDAPKGAFIKIFKTGNRKHYDGESENSAFFKQDFYKLASGWSFGFLAAFKENLPAAFTKPHIVSFGAERQPFLMEMTDNSFENIDFEDTNYDFTNFGTLYPPIEAGKILLLSDAKVEPTIYHNTKFAITDAVSFRNIQTKLHHSNDNWSDTSKSKRYNLLQRGSILWADDTSPLESDLKKAVAFRKIGYNYFKTH